MSKSHMNQRNCVKNTAAFQLFYRLFTGWSCCNLPATSVQLLRTKFQLCCSGFTKMRNGCHAHNVIHFPPLVQNSRRRTQDQCACLSVQRRQQCNPLKHYSLNHCPGQSDLCRCLSTFCPRRGGGKRQRSAMQDRGRTNKQALVFRAHAGLAALRQ